MIENDLFIFVFRYSNHIFNEMARIMYYCKQLIKFSLTIKFEKSAEESSYESILFVHKETYLLYA